MHISEIAVRRPVTTSMFYIGVLLIGVISLIRLAVDLLPDLSYPQLTIWTRYQNVAPEEIETFITKPVESALSTVSGIKKISSVSQEGVSLVSIEFEWGTNMDYTILSVREKLDKVRFDRFPDEASRPVIIRIDPSQQPIMSLSVSGDDLKQLKETATSIVKRRLEQIDGVALATVTGGLDREIQIDVDIDRMVTLGLQLGDIKSALMRSNVAGMGGYIRKGQFRYSLRTLGEFTAIDELKDVVIGTTDENLVYLRDIARISDGFRERDNITRFNGEESVGLIVQKEAGSNTVKVSERVKEVLVQLRTEFPQYSISVAYDQAEFIANSISNVVQAIVFGGILAFLVLFLFLHDLRNPVNIAVAIPLSIVATFTLLYFNGVSLNIMSLGGLALGVGLLVDNSIVVLENIFRHRQEGKNLFDATVAGAKEISTAVSASTFTTISVFFPIIFVEGVAGQLFRDQALTITFSLLCSLIVSLTLLPMLACHFMRFKKHTEEKEPEIEKKDGSVQTDHVEKEPGRFTAILKPFRLIFIDILFRYLVYYPVWKGIIYYVVWKAVIYFALYRFLLRLVLRPVYFLIIGVLRYWLTGTGRFLENTTAPLFKSFDKQFERFTDVYESVLSKALDNRGTTLAIAVSAGAAALLLGLTLDRELMPRVDQGQFEVEVYLPTGSTLEQTDLAALQVSNWLLENPDVESVFGSVGIVQEKGMQSVRSTSLNRGLLLVKLKENASVSSEHVIRTIRDRQHLLPVYSLNFSTGETTLQQVLGSEESDLMVNIKGEDFGLTTAMMEDLIKKMNEVDGLEDVHSNFEEGKPEISIRVDRDRADRYGISVSDVADFITFSMRGEIATQFKDFDRNIDILVRPDMEYRNELEDLLNAYITRDSLNIPVRELVHYEYTQGPNEIRREDQQRVVQVLANVGDRGFASVMNEVTKLTGSIELPGSDYLVEITGENREMNRSFRSLGIALLVSVALVYMILAAQFESLVQPFVIMFAVPLALIGVAFALFLTANSLNMMSAIGTIILVGIVVNDAIIKVDFINRAHRSGTPLRKAIEEAGKKRLRPIIMTTVTTVFGLTPMALGIGQGAQMQAPMAIAVIGGLLSATFLTLVVIPVIYSYLGRMGKAK